MLWKYNWFKLKNTVCEIPKTNLDPKPIQHTVFCKTQTKPIQNAEAVKRGRLSTRDKNDFSAQITGGIVTIQLNPDLSLPLNATPRAKNDASECLELIEIFSTQLGTDDGGS